MTVQHLEAAIHELAEAKRQAEFFHWPIEIIERIDLLKRAAAKVRAQMVSAKDFSGRSA